MDDEHKLLFRDLLLHIDNSAKFDAFEDQLKQLRLSSEYMSSNPHIAQQVLLSEGARARFDEMQEVEDAIFKISMAD